MKCASAGAAAFVGRLVFAFARAPVQLPRRRGCAQTARHWAARPLAVLAERRRAQTDTRKLSAACSRFKLRVGVKSHCVFTIFGISQIQNQDCAGANFARVQSVHKFVPTCAATRAAAAHRVAHCASLFVCGCRSHKSACESGINLASKTLDFL